MSELRLGGAGPWRALKLGEGSEESLLVNDLRRWKAGEVTTALCLGSIKTLVSSRHEISISPERIFSFGQDITGCHFKISSVDWARLGKANAEAVCSMAQSEGTFGYANEVDQC